MDNESIVQAEYAAAKQEGSHHRGGEGMTPPETVKSKATLRAEILRAMNDVSQELDMFDIEVAFQRAMEEYTTAMLDADAGEELVLYRITWDEKHVTDLLATSEDAAIERAAKYRPVCATRLNTDNHQVEVLEGLERC